MTASIQPYTGCHNQYNKERKRNKKDWNELKTVIIHKRYECVENL